MADNVDVTIVEEMVQRARVAQKTYERTGSQRKYDTASTAAAWALMESDRNIVLSELAVASTGLGNVEDKIKKNHRKTLGLLRDLQTAVTFGIIEEDAVSGITKIARGLGVVASVVPSTNPVATPTNNIVNALKCGNAIVLAPSPSGIAVCEKLVNYIHIEFDKIGIDKNLVQMLPAPASKAKTQRLMELADRLIVTGSQDNVRRAYSSGTPAIGVGAGNATVIVDETADLASAAQKIATSKTFDNATSCSSENVLIVVSSVYEPFVSALHKVGGRVLLDNNTEKLTESLFQDGKLNRQIIARDIDQVIDVTGVEVNEVESARFLVLPANGIGSDHPESGEKLSLVVALYQAADFEDAKEIASRILAYQGAGHSVGIHTVNDERAIALGRDLPVCRVIVNQAHAVATGGAFDNGLPFSLTMGCGSWGGNSIDENLHFKHFMNVTSVVRPVPPQEPSLDDVFGQYWQLAGR